MIGAPASVSAAVATGATAAQRLAAIEARIDAITQDATTSPVSAAAELLRLGEVVMEIWISARGKDPTHETKEGFRLIALHRQGTKGEPSFNACRETCRELVYHYNLVMDAAPSIHDTDCIARGEQVQTIRMMALVAKHLVYFVDGKMQVEGLGEFCCAAKPVRAGDGEVRVVREPLGGAASKPPGMA